MIFSKVAGDTAFMEFYEQQKFDQKWIKAIIYSFLILSVLLFIVIIYFEKAYVIAMAVLFSGIAFFALLKSIRLVVMIDRHSIRYKFFPVYTTFRTILIDNTLHLEVALYNPISEFGG